MGVKTVQEPMGVKAVQEPMGVKTVKNSKLDHQSMYPLIQAPPIFLSFVVRKVKIRWGPRNKASQEPPVFSIQDHPGHVSMPSVFDCLQQGLGMKLGASCFSSIYHKPLRNGI